MVFPMSAPAYAYQPQANSLSADLMATLRHAYQRDGRLAAAATVRQRIPGLSMTEALSTVDHALRLRKPSSLM